MTVENQLVQLENAQLVRRLQEQDLAYIFKHALTQETSYQSLLVKKRREIHRRVAEAYEQVYAGSLDEYAALLAQHYAEAGDDAKTLEYARRAGDVSARIYANTEAVAHYTLAIEVARRNARPDAQLLAHLYLKRGRCLELLSEFSKAMENYNELETLAHIAGEAACELTALMALATVRSIPSAARDPVEARAICNRALDLAHALGDRRAEAKILWNLLLCNIYSGGDPHEAVAYGEQSLAIARELHLREQEAFALHDLYIAYLYLGELERAWAVRVEASQIWRELNNQPMLAESLSGLGLTHVMRGEFAQAFLPLEEARTIGRAIGNLGAQAFSSYVASFACLEQGETARAFEYLKQCLPVVAHGALEGPGLDVQAQWGWIQASLGDFDGGRTLIGRSLTRAWQLIPLQRAWIYALLARIELLAGNLEAAEEAFREGGVVPSMDNFTRMFPIGAPAMYMAAAELDLARRDCGGALHVLDELVAHLNTSGMRVAVPAALYVRGQALLMQDEREAAITCWRQARIDARDMGARTILLPILSALSRAERERGNPTEAESLSNEAREIVRAMSAQAPDDLRQSFLNSPQVAGLV
ncbi:MAG: hypothetical protein WCF84_21000 [Anaerolineae bacterium]